MERNYENFIAYAVEKRISTLAQVRGLRVTNVSEALNGKLEVSLWLDYPKAPEIEKVEDAVRYVGWTLEASVHMPGRKRAFGEGHLFRMILNSAPEILWKELT